MERRELIKLVTLATGSALIIPFTSNLLVACKQVEKQDESDYALQFFNNEDFSLLKNLVDVILPKSNSPSATEVGVHQMIDTIVGKVYSVEQQQNFTKKFSNLKSYLKNSKNYTQSLQELSNSSEETHNVSKEAFIDIKQQTVLYFLNTKEVATTFLNYLPVPGKYKACISLEEVDGKAWAL
jgi:hypothetical protein